MEKDDREIMDAENPDIMDELQGRLDSALPRCLDSVNCRRVEILERRVDFATAFQLSQPGSKAREAIVLGFPLRDLNPAYVDREFVSPLFLRWPDGKLALIFDSDIHGYHGEMDCSAKYRGEGVPAEFACPECAGKSFRISVQFDYTEACCDLLEDDPEEKAENYFSNIIVSGQCVECGTLSCIVDMDL